MQARAIFLIALPSVVLATASCDQAGDDVVATLGGSSGTTDGGASADVSEVGPPPAGEVGPEAAPPPDVSDAGMPDPDVTIDVPVTPPVDAPPPTGCTEASPLVTVRRANGDSRENCTGQLAAHTFTHAICTCEDLSVSGPLTTESADSNSVDGGSNTAKWGASVGVGGIYPRGFYANIGGGLTIAGTRSSFAALAGFEIAGDLKIAGNATIGAQLSVKRDAWLGARISFVGFFARVERNVYATPGGGFIGITPVTVDGTTTTMPVTVEEPCGCGPDELLDVAGMVAAGMLRHENVDPTTLNDVAMPGITRVLECGRFYFERIGGAGAITVRVRGRAAVFVDGNVQASDLFQLQVDSGGELDLFIKGNLILTGAPKLGDTARPAATRIYVGGNADIQLPSGRGVALNLYAPNANVVIGANASEINGSIWAKSLSTAGALNVKYDRAMLTPGGKCGASPPDGCDKCQTCNDRTACVQSTCRACTTDGDCCAPFICDPQGLCQLYR